MQDRVDVLEKIAEKARYLRTLEKVLVSASDTRRVMDSLKTARAELDELLDDLAKLER